MKDSKDCAIVVLGKYSLVKEGICGVLQMRGYQALAAGTSASQIKLKTRAPKCLFIIIRGADDFGSVLSEISILKGLYPDATVAVVSEQHAAEEPAMAFAAGAGGYLTTNISCDAFVKSVELLMLGEAVFPPSFASPAAPRMADAATAVAVTGSLHADDRISAPLDAVHTPLLSPRETAILRCLIQGESNKFIARKIQIAEATVKAHVKAILRKIRVHNRTQAAIWGMNNAVLLEPANSNSVFAPIITDTN